MKLTSCLALSAALFLCALPAGAELAITNDEIISDSYTYTLTNGGLIKGLFAENVHEVENMDAYGVGGIWFVAPTIGVEPASLVYKFDFSKTSYRAVSVTLSDRLIMWSTTEGAKDKITVEYKIDDGKWTPLREVTHESSERTVEAIHAYEPIPLSTPGSPDGAKVFFYRVVFSDLSRPGNASNSPTQWGRVRGGETAFKAKFSMELKP